MMDARLVYRLKAMDIGLTRRVEMAGPGNFDRRAVLVLGAAALTGCGRTRNTGQGLIAGEAGRVARIIDGDALVLDTGQSVRLAEIEAPRKAGRDRKADAFGEDAAEMLALAALGRDARLFYGGLSRDRYDRALAHLIVKDETGAEIWVNGYMVRQGGARVRSYADNCARARDLYPLEDEARRAGKGLWVHHDYNVLSPLNLSNAGRGLCLVEGGLNEIADVAEAASSARAAADGGLALRLGYALARSSERPHLSIGDRIRLRGYARRGDNGVTIILDHWPQVEVLG